MRAVDVSSLEDALLWTMRAWVIGHCYDQAVLPRIGSVYARLGSASLADDLDGFMTALACGACRMLDVNCVCQSVVSDDETMLLDILALAQEDRTDDAYALLRVMLDENAASHAAAAASRLMLGLQAIGQVMPRALEALRRYAFIGRVPHGAPMEPGWPHLAM